MAAASSRERHEGDDRAEDDSVCLYSSSDEEGSVRGGDGAHAVVAGHSRRAPKRKRHSIRCRACVFTAHLDWKDEAALARALESLRSRAVYFVVGKEVCPSTGRPHLQGYAEFAKAVTIPGALVSDGLGHPHCEPRKGSQADAVKYCKKDGDFIEWGTPKKQGARTDIADIREAVVGGTLRSAKDVWLSANSYQSFRFGLAGISLVSPRRSSFWGIEWHYGPTGSGKSRAAWDRYPGAYAWDTGNWFEGYAGERVIIIDDYRRERCPFERLLRVCDRYPLRVECKGSSAELLATVVVITAPVTPAAMFGGLSEGNGSVAQIWRRCVALCEHIGPDADGDFDERWWFNRRGVGAGGLRGMDEGRESELLGYDFEPIDPERGFPLPEPAGPVVGGGVVPATDSSMGLG